MRKAKTRFLGVLITILIAIIGMIYLPVTNKVLSNGKNQNTKQKSQVVIKYAIDGLKAYREVDYQDKNYQGFNRPELFANSFRKSEVLGKAKQRLKEAQDKEMFRKIDKTKLLSVQVESNDAVVKLEIKEVGTQFGVAFIDTYTVTVNLSKSQKRWLISNIKMKNKYK